MKLSEKILEERVLGSIERDVLTGNICGASIMVSQHGEVVLSASRGSTHAFTQRDIREDSIFRLASMTKPVTAIAALIGVERGWFGLDDAITDHYPDIGKIWVGREENGMVVPDHPPRQQLKLYHFLSNCSGFVGCGPIYDLIENSIPAYAYKTNRTAVDYCIKNTCFGYEPVEQVGYCPYQAYDLLALLIEKYSGKCYSDFLNDEIFEPLGIKDMTYHPTEEQWSRIVGMSDKAVGGMVDINMGRHTFESFPLSYTCAGAGLVGTVRDYHTFASMLLGRGSLNGARIIKPETFDLMPRAYVPLEIMGKDALSSWGLGVTVYVKDGVRPKGSFGWSGAYGTHFWVDPKNGIVAIYMKNNRWHESHGCGRTGRQFEADVYSALIE